MASVQDLYEAGKRGARMIFECAVMEAPIPENATYSPILRTITINSFLTERERLLALGHELAHILQASPSVEDPAETDDQEKLIRDIVSEIAVYRALMRFSIDMTEQAFPRLCEYLCHLAIDFGAELPPLGPDSSTAKRSLALMQRLIAIADGQVNGHIYPEVDPRFTRMLRITTNFVYYIFMLYQGVNHE